MLFSVTPNYHINLYILLEWLFNIEEKYSILLQEAVLEYFLLLNWSWSMVAQKKYTQL